MAAGFALALTVTAHGTVAAEQSRQVEHEVFRGTIGPYPIGAMFDVANRVEFAGGSYYYASALQDIPLDGSLKGSDLTLKEPGGGVFELHFVVNGKSPADLTFYTSTGLVGTWTKGETSYPVRLDGDFSFSKEPGHEYGDVTAASDTVFEAMVRGFIVAVATGDRAAAAAAIHFPLRINDTEAKTFTVTTASELDANWSRIFTPAYVAKIKTVIPHHLFTHDGRAMIGDGEAWFDSRGAVAINPVRAR